MPVGIAPQKQRDKAEDRGKNGSLAGSFAASVSSSVGVYSKTSRSAHSFRLREPGAGPVRPPSRQSRATTPKFNDKERAVIANLDQLSSEVRPLLRCPRQLLLRPAQRSALRLTRAGGVSGAGAR
jgi:hypothetical protein